MKKRFVVLAFCLMIFVSASILVSAEISEINIKTAPRLQVKLVTFNPDSIEFLELKRFEGFSDMYGDISFEFESRVSKFDIWVYVYDFDKKVISKKFADNFEPGELISLEVFPTGYEILEAPTETENEIEEILVNDTEEIEDELLVDEEENESFITGLAVGNIINKNVIYSVIGIIILGVIIFVSIRLWKRRSGKKEIVIKKLSEMTQGNNVSNEIEEAERKIKEAQTEINKLKNQDKISAMEKKLQEDQETLKKLRD